MPGLIKPGIYLTNNIFSLYRFNIPNTKVKLYQFFAYGIILINLIIQLYIDYARGTTHYHVFTILVSLALLIIVCTDAYRVKKGKPVVPAGLLIVIIAVRWFRFGNYFAFFVNLLLWFLYTVSRRNLDIIISETDIQYPSYPKKNIGWKEVNNVILKDDILTIDCKNNKVYQHFLQNSEQYVNEEEFNDFCRKQLLEKDA